MDDWMSSERNCIVVFVFRSAALPNFYKEQSLCPRQLARGLPKLWGITLTRSKLWNLILTFFNSNILYRITLGNSFMNHYWLCRAERKFKKRFIFFLKKWLHFNLSCVCQKNKDILSGHQTPIMTGAIAHWFVVSNIKKQRVQWLLFW